MTVLRNASHSASAFVVLTVLVLPIRGATPPRPPASALDTTAAAIDQGRAHVEAGRLDDARLSFRHARELAPRSARAWAGLGLVDLLDRKTEAAKKKVGKARRLDDKDVFVLTVNARLLAALGKREKSLDVLGKAAKLAPNDPEPLYWAGEVQSGGGNADGARKSYLAALDRNPGYGPARKGLEKFDRLQSATVGLPQPLRSLADAPVVRREEFAALLRNEFDLATLFPKSVPTNVAFEPPGAAVTTSSKAAYPPDVAPDQWSRDAIAEVLARGVMTAGPGGQFRPTESVSRADAALTLVHVLAAMTREADLETRYLGTRSEYPDVPDGHYALSAVRVVVSRQLMSAGDDGRFRPADPVRGAEMMDAVARMKSRGEE